MVEISVIIPIYNVEKYLTECLDSVLNQTFKDFEIICVNDGSTDGSSDIINDYSQKYENITVINKENEGSGLARNTGLKHANGNYVFFMDSDDYLAENALEKLYENITSNKSDMVFFKKAIADDKGNINFKKPGFPLEKIIKDKDFTNYTFTYKEIKKHVLNSSFAPWHKLHDKSFLDEHEDIVFFKGAYEDVLFHIKTMLMAEKISYVNEFLYYYRDNSESVTHASHGFLIFDVIDSVEDYLKTTKHFDEFKEEFNLFKVTQILNYILISQSNEYFQKAKNEFEEVEIDENSLITGLKYEKYRMVMECENLYEYYCKYCIYIENDLNKKISELKSDNSKLKRKVKAYQTQNRKLKVRINELNKQSYEKSKLRRFFKK